MRTIVRVSTVKKTVAYKSDFDSRKLFHTARSAREAEFDHLMWRITQNVGSRDHLIECLSGLAHDLRGGVYPSAATAFIEAADYLRVHHLVMTGAELDPDEEPR